jgi:REP element-mobilizing transposase RayT
VRVKIIKENKSAVKNRKVNRLKGYDYSKNNLYFVTNCVKNNLCCLGAVVPVGTGRDLSVHNTVHNAARNPVDNAKCNPTNDSYNKSIIDFEMQLNQYGLLVDEKINWLQEQYPYVEIHVHQVMPNHFHLILEINSLIVKDLEIKIKSLSSLLGVLKTTSSKLIHDAGFDDFQWHRSFHDHIIRDEKSYLNIFNYIINNPNNWKKDCFNQKD